MRCQGLEVEVVEEISTEGKGNTEVAANTINSNRTDSSTGSNSTDSRISSTVNHTDSRDNTDNNSTVNNNSMDSSSTGNSRTVRSHNNLRQISTHPMWTLMQLVSGYH